MIVFELLKDNYSSLKHFINMFFADFDVVILFWLLSVEVVAGSFSEKLFYVTLGFLVFFLVCFFVCLYVLRNISVE